MIIPIFLPHSGCRDKCIYCNQAYITDLKAHSLKENIASALGKQGGPFEVGLFGGNILNIEPSRLRRIFTFFEPYGDRISNFRISSKPLPLTEELIRILKENKVTVIELGIPTFNDKILATLNRRHTAGDFFAAYDTLNREGFSVGLQFMVGLPGEAKGDIRLIAQNMVALRPVYVRIYPLVVLDGTPLAEMYRNGIFTPATLDEALDRTALIYLSALRENIKVVRIGLSDNELIKDKIIGGHYHPAFGYLVKARVFFLAIMSVLETFSARGNITIGINKADVPHLLGYRRSHMKIFEEKGFSIIHAERELPKGTFVIEGAETSVTGNIFDAFRQLS